MQTRLTIGATTRPHSKLSYTEAFARIARAGYTDVAVFASEGKVPVSAESTPAEVAAVRRAAADAGLAPSMVLARTRLDLGVAGATDNYCRLVDSAAAVGARWLLDLGTGDQARYDDYVAVMRGAAPHAKAAGLAISMKPHGGITLTVENLLQTCTAVDHPAFGICFDPGNIIYYTQGERRPESDVDAVAVRVTTGIIKDCVVVDGKPDVMVTAGDGLVDFPVVLGKLVGGGFRGPVYVECVGSAEPDRVDADLAFTRGYVAGILASLA
ncbi:MAG: TIM barrel protein [Gemmatimonadota bacterium]